jgi:hypothetical protein
VPRESQDVHAAREILHARIRRIGALVRVDRFSVAPEIHERVAAPDKGRHVRSVPSQRRIEPLERFGLVAAREGDVPGGRLRRGESRLEPERQLDLALRIA